MSVETTIILNRLVNMTDYLERLNHKVDTLLEKVNRLSGGKCNCHNKPFITEHPTNNNDGYNFCMNDFHNLVNNCVNFDKFATKVRTLLQVREFVNGLDYIYKNYPHNPAAYENVLFKNIELTTTLTNEYPNIWDYKPILDEFLSICERENLKTETALMNLIIFDFCLRTNQYTGYHTLMDKYEKLKNTIEFNMVCDVFNVDHTIYPSLFKQGMDIVPDTF